MSVSNSSSSSRTSRSPRLSSTFSGASSGSVVSTTTALSTIVTETQSPFPGPAPTGPPPNSGRGRDQDGNSLQNSAQLYLYTFLADQYSSFFLPISYICLFINRPPRHEHGTLSSPYVRRNLNPNPAGPAPLSSYSFLLLATLILLLGVSAAIVLRSLLLRRRNRRLIEEAIRNGTWVPPTDGDGGRRRKIGERPKFYEVYLGVPTELAESLVLGAPQKTTPSDTKEKEKAVDQRNSFTYDWDVIQPFSVSSSNTGSSAASTIEPATVSPPGRPSIANRLGGALTRLRLPLARPPVSSTVTSPSPSTDVPLKDILVNPLNADDEKLRGPLNVSVLIAMPSQTRLSTVLQQARASGDDEGELPHLVVGVAQNVLVEDGHGPGHSFQEQPQQASANASTTRLGGPLANQS